MNLFDVIREVRHLLEENGRVSQRLLRRQFDLDDDSLDEVVEELVDVPQVATREGAVLVWTGAGGVTAGASKALVPATGLAVQTDRAPVSYTPKHLANRILQSRSALEGERNQVTVLFADVKGSMELAEQLDPEEWHSILECFFAMLAVGVHRFEGTVNQYTGDGIMALFGAPIAPEDHAQRACYAALHQQEEIARYAIGDDLRMD